MGLKDSFVDRCVWRRLEAVLQRSVYHRFDDAIIPVFLTPQPDPGTRDGHGSLVILLTCLTKLAHGIIFFMARMDKCLHSYRKTRTANDFGADCSAVQKYCSRYDRRIYI